MTLFTSPWLLLGVSVILIICIISAVASAKGNSGKNVANILTVVNITLHIAAILGMMLFGIPLEEVTLVFMTSAFVYTFSNCVSRWVCEKRGDADDI